MAYHLCLHSHCGNRRGPLSVIQPGRLGWDTSLAPGSWCYGTHDTPPPSLTFLLKQESANHFGVAIYVNHNKGVWCMVGTQKIVTARIITMATTAVGGEGMLLLGSLCSLPHQDPFWDCVCAGMGRPILNWGGWSDTLGPPRSRSKCPLKRREVIPLSVPMMLPVAIVPLSLSPEFCVQTFALGRILQATHSAGKAKA